MNISLKIGFNIIDSVFDVCNKKKGSDEGLNLSEITENGCFNFLENTFGMLHEDIEKDFEVIDKNGDGLISKEEAVNAYQDLNRKNKAKTIDDDYPNLELKLYTFCGNTPLTFTYDDDTSDLAESFRSHNFRAYNPTKIIAHGFKADADDFYSWYIKAYKSSGCNVNIICIHWEEYSDGDKKV